MSNDLPNEPGSQASHSQPRGLSTVPYSALTVAGLAAIALVVSASTAPHADAASAGRIARHAPATAGQGHGAPPSGTKAESLRLARKLLGKVVLPAGARTFHGKRLPPGLRGPAEMIGAQTIADAHRAVTEKGSLRQVIRFLHHHHPAGWAHDGSGASWHGSHGKEVITEKDVSYRLREIGPRYSVIEMNVEVVPGHHGHAFARADVEVVWFPPRSAAEHLVAGDFKSVTIHEERLGKEIRHSTRTFKQHAIIGKLTRVLNHEHASPGGFVSCPAEFVTYELTFTPKQGHPKAVISASGCFQYGITVGGKPRHALVDDGKVESIARHLMREHGHQVHPGGTPKTP